MVISARYKHFLYFPLRLIDYPSPEVREYLSSSCRIIKIRSKKYSSTSLLGADAAPVSDDPRPLFPSEYTVHWSPLDARPGDREHSCSVDSLGNNKYYKSVSASRNLLHRRNSTLDKTDNDIHKNLLILDIFSLN